jgi:hypothetical protein
MECMVLTFVPVCYAAHCVCKQRSVQLSAFVRQSLHI